MPNTMTAAMDKLTNTWTAWSTFAEMVAACRTGYVPTIRQPSLRAALVAEGCKIWPEKI